MRDKKTINAYYLRLSLEDGDVTDGLADESCSIGSQRMCIQQFLSVHSELGGDFQEFADDGYSGTNMDRPAMRQLLGLVHQGLVKTIIVRDLSRFARNYLEAGHYLEFVFPTYGVRFISLNDHYDSLTCGENPAGLDLALRNLINEMYSRDISRKIKSALDLKKKNGEYLANTAPFGYRLGPMKNTVSVDSNAAIIVQRIFRMACDGRTISEIARTLNQDQIPTPSQYMARMRGHNYKVSTDWTWTIVRHLISNRFYTGDTEFHRFQQEKVGSRKSKTIPPSQREIVPNTHPALVSLADFEQAQKIIRTKKQSVPKKTPPNPLTSVLVCGCCGRRLTSVQQAQGTLWYCAHTRYNPERDCRKVRIPEAELNRFLVRAIRSRAEATKQLMEQRQQACRAAQAKYSQAADQLELLQEDLDAMEQKRLRLLDLMVSGTVDREEYLEEKIILNAEAEQTRQQMNRLREAMTQLQKEAEADPVPPGAETVLQYRQIKKLRPEAVDLLIQNVTVFPTNKPKIEWNFEADFSNFSICKSSNFN